MAAPGSDSGRACGLPRKRRRRSAVSANKRWRRSVMAAHGHTRPFRALRLRLLSWSKPTCAAVSTPPGSSSFGLTPDKGPPPGGEADVCGMSAKMGRPGDHPASYRIMGKKSNTKAHRGERYPGWRAWRQRLPAVSEWGIRANAGGAARGMPRCGRASHFCAGPVASMCRDAPPKHPAASPRAGGGAGSARCSRSAARGL
jgi:hypothetical protein